MSTTRQTAATAADRADRLSSAAFVRIVARADGDGLAAAGVLARTLAARGVPFQASVARTDGDLTRRIERADASAAEGDCTVLVGRPDVDADVRIDEDPASVAAWRVAREVDSSEPVLALAGAVAAGATPTVEADPAAPVLDAAAEAGLVDRRPGVAVPTADAVDGLAHSTLVHAPFSGDPDAVRESLGGLAEAVGEDDQSRRELASAVALSVVGASGGTDRAAVAVERSLRPHATEAPFASVEGYADVLDTVAREAPGTAIGLALGHGAREAALSAWREHARAAHAAVRSAEGSRYDGVFVARVDPGAPVETVARLVCEYRSPEPIALVVADSAAAVAAPDDRGLDETMRSVVESTGGESGGTDRRGYARFESDPAALVAAVREALA